MSVPTEAQVKKFWEKIGYAWTIQEHGYSFTPPIDLNNLFEYAVPKLLQQLDKDGRRIILKLGESRDTEGEWVFLFEDWQPNSYHWAHHEDPALALFWAIWEVIKK